MFIAPARGLFPELRRSATKERLAPTEQDLEEQVGAIDISPLRGEKRIYRTIEVPMQRRESDGKYRVGRQDSEA